MKMLKEIVALEGAKVINKNNQKLRGGCPTNPNQRCFCFGEGIVPPGSTCADGSVPFCS